MANFPKTPITDEARAILNGKRKVGTVMLKVLNDIEA